MTVADALVRAIRADADRELRAALLSLDAVQVADAWALLGEGRPEEGW